MLSRRLGRLLAIVRRGRWHKGRRHSGRQLRFRGLGRYLGGADSSQYSSLAQIDKSNVGQLEVAWTYSTAENYSFNPLVVGNTMYVLAKGRSIVALDAATGRELWRTPTKAPSARAA